MKNGKKTTKKNTETTTAETSELDSANIETGAENTNAETENQPIETEANKPLYVLIESTNKIVEAERFEILDILGEEHSQKEIDEMLSGEKTIVRGDFVYASDMQVLEVIITANQDAETETAETELTYDFDEPQPKTDGDHSETIEDILGIEKVDEIIDDPNEPIYEFFRNDENFRGSLTKKQKTVIEKLVDGNMFVANLGKTETKTWESIQQKFADFEPTKEVAETKSESSDDEQEPIENFRRSESLEKSETTVEIEIVEDEAPLNDEETAELAERETAIVQAKEQFENSTQIMADNLYEIRHKNLFRDSGKNFEDYASERFGIAKKYAHLLAQRGSFRLALSEIGEQPLQLALSANATEQWAQDTNKIAKQLGVKTSDYDVMKPIIEAVSGVIAESATDANGELTSVAPRIFSAANDMIPEIIKSGMIEVNGEQMKIEDVLGLGEEILTESLKTQIIENVAEGIKTQKQNIIDYIKDVKSNRTKPHEPAPTPKAVDSKKVFKGLVPSYSVTCSVHKNVEDNRVRRVFNAGFELFCNCKYQLLQGYDELQCIETDGLMVQWD